MVVHLEDVSFRVPYATNSPIFVVEGSISRDTRQLIQMAKVQYDARIRDLAQYRDTFAGNVFFVI